MLRVAIVLLVMVAACASMAQRPAEIAHFQISIEARFIGVAQTDLNEFGFSAAATAEDPPKITFFDYDGIDLTEGLSVLQEDADGWDGFGDIVFFDGLIWGSWCPWIRALEASGHLSTYFFGPLPNTRAITTNGTDWFATAPGQPIYKAQWDGLTGSTPGWQSITLALPNTSGIAHDPDLDCLWVTNTNGTVYKYSPSGIYISEHTLNTSHGILLSCHMANERGYTSCLAVLQSNTRTGDTLVLYDMSDTPVEAGSWASIKAMFR